MNPMEDYILVDTIHTGMHERHHALPLPAAQLRSTILSPES